MNAHELLVEAEDLTNGFLDKNQSTFLKLDIEQLQWKPSPKKWSIEECIAHINFTGHHYIPAFQKVLDKYHGMSGYEWVDEYKPSWIGKKSALQMRPQKGLITNKMKTFGSVNPSKKSFNHEVLKEFQEQEETWLHIINQCKEVNINKVKVQTLLPILKFRMGDALRFVTYHTERHILQAENVLKMIGEVRSEK